MNQMNETSIRLLYFLGISLRFNSSDRGYYWCQMVVNNLPLSPSPYGHINDSQCPIQNVTCNIDQPLCAQNIRAQYMAFRQINGCSLKYHQPHQIVVVYDTSQSSNNDSLATVYPAGIVTGLILILSLLTAIALCIFFRSKRTKGIKV